MSQLANLQENIKNIVEYELYLSKCPDKDLIEGYRERVQPILRGHLEDFFLHVNKESNVCYGSLNVNQNIEQEWLIVYALYELSKFDEDLVIKVNDSDGDILLIEAAEELPKWLESRKSKNRVFIHRGKVHIIPEDIKLSDLRLKYEQSQTVTQAAACFVRDMNSSKLNQVRTLADNPIQTAIEDQLSGMPDMEAWLDRKFKQLDDIISGRLST